MLSASRNTPVKAKPFHVASAGGRTIFLRLFLAFIVVVSASSPTGRGLDIGVFVDATASPAITRGGAAIRSPKPAVTGKKLARDARQAIDGQKKEIVKSFGRKIPSKATAFSPPDAPSSIPTNAILGALAMAMVERIVKKVFISNGITFPPQLAGCIILFFSLLLADVIVPGLGNKAYVALGPGTALLTKWLPVFFVPGLAMLPLAPSVGSGMEVAKVLLVTGLGFVYSLYTIAFSVLFLRAASGGLVATPPPAPATRSKASKVLRKAAAAVVATVPPPPTIKAYSDETMNLLAKIMTVTGLASVETYHWGWDGKIWATPLRSLFFFTATCWTYVWGARLPPAFTKTVHPLVTSTILLWGVLYGFATLTGGEELIDMLKIYRTGTLEVAKTGAGDILLFLLGPSVVSFAVSMYSRKNLLQQNLWIVVASMVISSVGALFGTAAFGRLIQLGGMSQNGLMIRLSMLARNVTTALAMPITSILGGDVSIAVVVVVLTGIIGAQYGRRLLDAAGIHDPVTRGLAVGGAAQGLGVSSMVSESDAFPFAAMAMVLTAVCSTCLVSIPAVRDTLVGMSS